jgi:hypothetical protein
MLTLLKLLVRLFRLSISISIIKFVYTLLNVLLYYVEFYYIYFLLINTKNTLIINVNIKNNP